MTQLSAGDNKDIELTYCGDDFYLPSMGTIGKLYEDDNNERYYVSFREHENHFFYRDESYPLDVSTIEELKEKGIEKVMIIEKDELGVYIMPLSSYIETDNSIRDHSGTDKCPPISEAIDEFTLQSGFEEEYPDKIQL